MYIFTIIFNIVYMDNFKEFITYIQNKKQNDITINSIEKKCMNIFHNVMTNTLLNAKSNTIDVMDIFNITHDLVLKENIRIVCLMFSNGEKIFKDKRDLCIIKYFKFMMEDSEIINNDNVIIEIQLTGVIDNYKIISDILHFIETGFILNNADIFIFHDLLVVDDYLLGIERLNCHNLKDFITRNFQGFIPNDIVTNNKELYDTIYKICKLCNINPNVIFVSPNNINYNSGFMDSLLYASFDTNHKTVIHKYLHGVF